MIATQSSNISQFGKLFAVELVLLLCVVLLWAGGSVMGFCNFRESVAKLPWGAEVISYFLAESLPLFPPLLVPS